MGRLETQLKRASDQGQQYIVTFFEDHSGQTQTRIQGTYTAPTVFERLASNLNGGIGDLDVNVTAGGFRVGNGVHGIELKAIVNPSNAVAWAFSDDDVPVGTELGTLKISGTVNGIGVTAPVQVIVDDSLLGATLFTDELFVGLQTISGKYWEVLGFGAGNGRIAKAGFLIKSDGIYMVHSLDIDQGLYTLGSLNAQGLLEVKLSNSTFFHDQSQCFVAGTMISLPDNKSKPIESVTIGDVVVSYNKGGTLRPRQVTRTFQKDVEHVLDFFGTGITPGHVTLCGEGKFAGQHVPIIDILRSDGAIVKEDGTLIRAATGCQVDSEGDAFVTAITGERLADGHYQIETVGQLRAGTRFRNDEGIDISVLELIEANDGKITEDGMVLRAGSDTSMPFVWTFGPELPKPEDYVLSRSGFRLDDLYEANEWEGSGPRLPIPFISG